jgi:hypothetical protein
MELMRINSWDEYQSIISQIKSKYSSCTILYRGQANAKWLLESTLERYRPSSWTVLSYSELSFRCAYQIESFTEKKWNLDHISKTEVEIDSHSYNIPIPYYRFWAYLRHHKFPSPLLDWTMSPYIAAFFAFEEDIRKKEAAIFAYIEYPCGMKIWQEGPKIETLKPEVGTDKRHFLQQSSYSVCTNYKNGSHQFVCHEEIFQHGKPNQDALIKICIPRTERKKILSYLNEVNINHWSLFQTDEALMQTLAFKEIDSRGL